MTIECLLLLHKKHIYRYLVGANGRDNRNGMGTTIFFVLEGPPSGGDTLYLSTTAAYEHLSEDFRRRIAGLNATHSGFSQAAVHQHRERYIREPIETIHPVVRTHPVSGRRLLLENSRQITDELPNRLPRASPFTLIGCTPVRLSDGKRKKVVRQFN